ncbi:MAG: hypothetical protein LQ350_002914 [Teloschistes chrysophthalmus]|nr:MAG: hypothetical protein LQ350_002914 [Niorma chrysophthalma]
MDPSQASQEALRASLLEQFHAKLRAGPVSRKEHASTTKKKTPTWASVSEQHRRETHSLGTGPDDLARRLATMDFGKWHDEDYLGEWVSEDKELWWEANMTVRVRVLLRCIAIEINSGLLIVSEARLFLTPDRSLDRELLERGQAPSCDEKSVREAIFGCLDSTSERTKPVLSMAWSPWFANVRLWLLEKTRPPSGIQRQHLLYRLQQCRAHVLFQHCFGGRSPPEEINIQWCLVNEVATAFKDLVREQRAFEKYIPAAHTKHNAKWHNALAVLAASDWCLDHNPPYRSNEERPPYRIPNECFRSAIADMRGFEEYFNRQGDLRSLCESRITKVRLIFNRCILYITGMGLFYDKIEIAEKTCNQMRLEAGAANVSGSFLAKALVVRSNNLQLMYRIALSQFLMHQEGDGPDCDCCVLDDEYKVFIWVQKSKTRALNDLMGLAASEHASSKKPVLKLPGASSITPEQFQEFAQSLGDDVVMFEWAHCRYDKQDRGDILLLVYRKGEVLLVKRLPVKLRKVTRWVDRVLDNGARPLAGEGDAGEFQELEALVEPVLYCSRPGETLIFCPTLQLHRIPLHGLSPKDELLIERNPIHYCQSPSLLRLCEFTNHRGADLDFRASVFNTLKNASGSVGTRPSVHRIDEVASLLHTKTVQQNQISKSELRQRAAESCILHVHGHVGFDLEDPLRNHLVLRDPPSKDEDRYTLDEIFETPLHRPCLVVAMGCNSGRSGDFEHDNLLGLLAALHYSGASSVISTLWAVHYADCMRFSKAFYTHLMADMEDTEAESEFVDVAKAFQKAVITAQRDERGEPLPPYKWAGFYLHGAGRMPRFALAGE